MPRRRKPPPPPPSHPDSHGHCSSCGWFVRCAPVCDACLIKSAMAVLGISQGELQRRALRAFAACVNDCGLDDLCHHGEAN